MELDCITSGSVHAKDIETVIHHEDEGVVNDEMSCTKNGIVCTRTIPFFSLSENGRYFCTVVIGDKHFSSKMRAIKIIDSNNGGKSGLKTSSKIMIGIGAFGVLLLIALTVSIVANVYMYYKRWQVQRRDGDINLDGNIHEGQPLLGKYFLMLTTVMIHCSSKSLYYYYYA